MGYPLSWPWVMRSPSLRRQRTLAARSRVPVSSRPSYRDGFPHRIRSMSTRAPFPALGGCPCSRAAMLRPCPRQSLPSSTRTDRTPSRPRADAAGKDERASTGDHRARSLRTSHRARGMFSYSGSSKALVVSHFLPLSLGMP